MEQLPKTEHEQEANVEDKSNEQELESLLETIDNLSGRLKSSMLRFSDKNKRERFKKLIKDLGHDIEDIERDEYRP